MAPATAMGVHADVSVMHEGHRGIMDMLEDSSMKSIDKYLELRKDQECVVFVVFCVSTCIALFKGVDGVMPVLHVRYSSAKNNNNILSVIKMQGISKAILFQSCSAL